MIADAWYHHHHRRHHCGLVRQSAGANFSIETLSSGNVTMVLNGIAKYENSSYFHTSAMYVRNVYIMIKS